MEDKEKEKPKGLLPLLIEPEKPSGLMASPLIQSIIDPESYNKSVEAIKAQSFPKLGDIRNQLPAITGIEKEYERVRQSLENGSFVPPEVRKLIDSHKNGVDNFGLASLNSKYYTAPDHLTAPIIPVHAYHSKPKPLILDQTSSKQLASDIAYAFKASNINEPIMITNNYNNNTANNGSSIVTGDNNSNVSASFAATSSDPFQYLRDEINNCTATQTEKDEALSQLTDMEQMKKNPSIFSKLLSVAAPSLSIVASAAKLGEMFHMFAK